MKVYLVLFTCLQAQKAAMNVNALVVRNAADLSMSFHTTSR